MNTTTEEGHALAVGILEGISARDVGFSTVGCDIGFYPPATSLGLIADLCSTFEGCRTLVGAQNMHAEASGAFTGEISSAMVLPKPIPCGSRASSVVSFPIPAPPPPTLWTAT